MSCFNAVQISNAVYWVGAIDWSLRNFHGYETRRGSTYNAYLVKGNDGYILIDTVKKGFENELLSRIRSVCDPKEIKFIISNHAEMDHSGAIPEILSHVSPDVKLYASTLGVKALNAHFGSKVNPVPVANGTVLPLLGRNFRCVETRMLHWPDSMWTYDETDRILFTNDAFGMHLAGYERWADDCDENILEEESAKYFANILTPYAPLIAKLIKAYPTLELAPAAVCPDHGPCWRNDGIAHILERYRAWSAGERKNRAVIVFDTMWHSTERMAHAIGEGLNAHGIDACLMPLSGSHRSDVAKQLLDARACIIGSPTLNNGIMPTVADLLCYIKGLKFKLDTTAAFGSYGWAPAATKQIDVELSALSDAHLPPLNVLYVPTDKDLEDCRQFGEQIAASLKN